MSSDTERMVEKVVDRLACIGPNNPERCIAEIVHAKTYLPPLGYKDVIESILRLPDYATVLEKQLSS